MYFCHEGDFPGSIPACAGETLPLVPPLAMATVYPRVCGGNPTGRSRRIPASGLSPRVRGKHRRRHRRPDARRSIPACAGETECSELPFSSVRVYPRVCGGNALDSRGKVVIRGLSPRVRGKLTGLRTELTTLWSIPACAGETSDPPGPPSRDRVYPRVCGGNRHHLALAVIPAGLSPRVRGKLSRIPYNARSSRSIPACAGETAAVR